MKSWPCVRLDRRCLNKAIMCMVCLCWSCHIVHKLGVKRIMSIKESMVIRTTVVRAIRFHWLLEFCGSIFMDQILIMKTTRFCTVQKISTPTLILKHVLWIPFYFSGNILFWDSITCFSWVKSLITHLFSLFYPNPHAHWFIVTMLQ